MPKFRVTAIAPLEVAVEVEAESWEEAEEMVEDYDLNVCIHGSEMLDGGNDQEFVLVDGALEYPYEHINAEEIE